MGRGTDNIRRELRTFEVFGRGGGDRNQQRDFVNTGVNLRVQSEVKN